MVKWEFGCKKIILNKKELNNIECTNILHIERCLPPTTDDKTYGMVYYETKIDIKQQ